MILSLPFSLPDATPIGDRYAMQTRDGFTYYFFNLEPFDCHPADDRRAMLLRAAKLHVVSGVRQADIMAGFHLSRPTVARAVKRYRERGEDAFFEPRRGRGRTVVDARMADEAAKLLASGISGSACANQLSSTVLPLPRGPISATSCGGALPPSRSAMHCASTPCSFLRPVGYGCATDGCWPIAPLAVLLGRRASLDKDSFLC